MKDKYDLILEKEFKKYLKSNSLNQGIIDYALNKGTKYYLKSK